VVSSSLAEDNDSIIPAKCLKEILGCKISMAIFVQTLYMKHLLTFLACITITAFIVSCKSGKGEGAKTFCDTTCFADTLEFTGTHADKPYIEITPKACGADSIFINSAGMATMTKTKFDYSGKKINKNFIRCLFKDADYAWILFNDCEIGRGYQLKIPFKQGISYEKRSSALNNFDKKFAVADNLVVAMDRGNLFVEDATTGKKAMMTFGKALTEEMDYDNIHQYVDSINVTNDRIWAKVLLDNKWEEIEKKTVTWK
jgi:hypothetical protein